MRIPPIKSANYNGESIILIDDENNEIIFENPLFVYIGDNFGFMVEWANSGPSGPWGRSVTKDFIGLELSDNKFHTKGLYQFSR